MRTHIKNLNGARDRGATGEQQPLRCEQVPALSWSDSASTARGVRRFRRWSNRWSPCVTSILRNHGVRGRKRIARGRGTRRDVSARPHFIGGAGLLRRWLHSRASEGCPLLSDDPAVRAARVVDLFTSDDARIAEAIRVAVSSQSTRKRITPKLCNETIKELGPASYIQWVSALHSLRLLNRGSDLRLASAMDHCLGIVALSARLARLTGLRETATVYPLCRLP